MESDTDAEMDMSEIVMNENDDIFDESFHENVIITQEELNVTTKIDYMNDNVSAEANTSSLAINDIDAPIKQAFHKSDLKYVFVVPYRQREEHKHFFDRHMKYILEDYDEESYLILYAHQNNELKFNRGGMKNMGFLFIKENYPDTYKDIVFIFNDVDTLPYKKDLLEYDCEENEIKHFYGYKFALGGIVAMRGSVFEKLNGFPSYYSWGYEDNVLQNRAKLNNVPINRETFYTIESHKILHFFDDLKKLMSVNVYSNLRKNNLGERDGLDTLKNINYKWNDATNMLDVNHFTSLYNPHTDKYFVHNYSDGTKVKYGKRIAAMKMKFN